MRDTIKAKVGYRVLRKVVKDSDSDLVTLYATSCIVLDGTDVVMTAELRCLADYERELKYGENEAASFCECFTTIRGDKFIYWRDEETDEDFLTLIERGNIKK